MIVVDASAAMFALLSDGPARRTLANNQLHTPYLVDSEVTSGLRKRVRAGAIGDQDATLALRVWVRLGLLRYSVRPMLPRMWGPEGEPVRLRRGVTSLWQSRWTVPWSPVTVDCLARPGHAA